MNKLEETDAFNKEELNNEYIKEVLLDVIKVIESKNYNAVNQLLGYIKTDNPIYIPRANNARDKIIKIKKDYILEFLINHFIEENKC